MAGTEMPDSIRVKEGVLRLNGMALYRKLGVPVLVGGLYLSTPESGLPGILAADLPRRYVTHFLRRVGSRRICEAWRKGLEDNSPEAGEQVRAQFRTLCHWIRDFHSGDDLTVTYLPTSGSWVEINGTQVGVVPGRGFADAYFGLALGPKPSLGDKFKGRLLGR